VQHFHIFGGASGSAAQAHHDRGNRGGGHKLAHRFPPGCKFKGENLLPPMSPTRFASELSLWLNAGVI